MFAALSKDNSDDNDIIGMLQDVADKEIKENIKLQ